MVVFSRKIPFYNVYLMLIVGKMKSVKTCFSGIVCFTITVIVLIFKSVFAAYP